MEIILIAGIMSFTVQKSSVCAVLSISPSRKVHMAAQSPFKLQAVLFVA